MINNKITFVKKVTDKKAVPYYVRAIESAELYRYMAKQESPRMEFIDSRNIKIFETLENIYEQGGLSFMSESFLLVYLQEHGLLEEAGGESYVKNVFGGYEPEVSFVL